MLREEGPGDRQRQSMGLITANHFCVFSFPQPMDPPPILVLSFPSIFRPFLSTRVPATLLHLYSRSPYHPLFSSHHLPSASYVACTAAHSRPISLPDPLFPSPTLAGRPGRRHVGRGRAPVEGRVPPLELLHGALEEPVRPLQQAGALL